MKALAFTLILTCNNESVCEQDKEPQRRLHNGSTNQYNRPYQPQGSVKRPCRIQAQLESWNDSAPHLRFCKCWGRYYRAVDSRRRRSLKYYKQIVAFELQRFLLFPHNLSVNAKSTGRRNWISARHEFKRFWSLSHHNGQQDALNFQFGVDLPSNLLHAFFLF